MLRVTVVGKNLFPLTNKCGKGTAPRNLLIPADPDPEHPSVYMETV